MILAPKNKEEIINLLGSLTEKEKNNMVLMAARTHQYISLQIFTNICHFNFTHFHWILTKLIKLIIQLIN